MKYDLEVYWPCITQSIFVYISTCSIYATHLRYHQSHRGVATNCTCCIRIRRRRRFVQPGLVVNFRRQIPVSSLAREVSLSSANNDHNIIALRQCLRNQLQPLVVNRLCQLYLLVPLHLLLQNRRAQSIRQRSFLTRLRLRAHIQYSLEKIAYCTLTRRSLRLWLLFELEEIAL